MSTRKLAWTALVILVLANAALGQEEVAPPIEPLATAVEASIRASSFWFSSEYLGVFMRGSNLPPLVTTSPAGTAQTAAGVFGKPATGTLFGAGWVNDDWRSGLRFGAGFWFGAERRLGIDAGFTLIESQSTIFSANSTDGRILARPYVDARDATQQAVLVAFPGLSNGSIDIRVQSGNYYGGHIDLAENVFDEGWFRFIALIGYRYYTYSESMQARQVMFPTSPAFVAGTQIIASDNFGARNDFHGCDLGFRAQFVGESLTLDLLGKIAIGRLHREVFINGDTTISVPGAATVVRNGGVLALPTNSGNFITNDWKAVPEFGATLKYRIRPRITLTAGYSVLLLNGIARASEQIDTQINPLFFPGGAGTGIVRPVYPARRSDLWIQSINAGVEFTF